MVPFYTEFKLNLKLNFKLRVYTEFERNQATIVLIVDELEPFFVRSMRTENKSKYTKPIDEKSPLLPRRQEEEEVAFDEFNGASVSGAVFNLSTTIVGAGIMALPATMKVIGLVPGIAMIIFMAFLTEASIEFILRFGQEARVASYGGLMGDAFGKFGRVLYQVIILINVAGTLIVYMIIIGMISYDLIYKDCLFCFVTVLVS